jgi:tripartite ATP-independent transporter DctP family solute receptor
MKPYRSPFIACVLALAAAAAPSAAFAGDDIKPRLMRFAVCVPTDHPLAIGAQKFSELVAAKSAQTLNAKVFDGCKLGSDSQAIAALRAGTLELAAPSTTPAAAIVKELGMLDLPFVFAHEREADAVLDGPLGKSLLDKLPEKGLVGLAYWENGFRNTINSKRAIQTADDYKGLKLRVQQNTVFIDTFNALGANAVPLPQTEVFTALETKAIDAYEGSLVNISAFKFYEVQKFVTVDRHAYTPFVLLVGKKLWDGLSAKERQVLQEAAIEARDHQRRVSRDLERKALALLKDKGMQANELSPQEVAKMAERVKPVVDKHKAEIGASLVDRMYAEVAKVRAQK